MKNWKILIKLFYSVALFFIVENINGTQYQDTKQQYWMFVADESVKQWV